MRLDLAEATAGFPNRRQSDERSERRVASRSPEPDVTLALLTDIHGNAPALSAVLAELDRRKIDRLYSLGDAVGLGPDSNEVLDLLTRRPGIRCVSGNHEDAVLAAYEGRPAPPGHESEREHQAWLAARLRPDHARTIAAWPRSIEAEIGGYRLNFVHYHLDEKQGFLPIDPDPSAEKLDRLYAEKDYDFVGFGHHHILHDYVSDRRIYFNPGALGCGGPIARCGLVHISEEGIRTEVLEVPYDNSGFLRSYRDLGVPDAEAILRIFQRVDLSEYGTKRIFP